MESVRAFRPSKLAKLATKFVTGKSTQMPVLTGREQADWSAVTRPRVKTSKNPQSAVFRSLKPTGTALALKGKDIGSAIPEAGGIVRRGRRSTGLRLREVENILAAADNTARKHRALNRFTTIHFEAATVPDPVWAIGRLIKLAGDWLRTKGAALSYIWVREAGEGKGDHVHILWHVPPNLIRDFAKRERGWRRLMGAKPRKGAFKSKPVGLSYCHGSYGIQYGQHYSEALAGVLSYIIKGAEPKVAEALGLALRQPCELWGKRYGMSENINRSARYRVVE